MAWNKLTFAAALASACFTIAPAARAGDLRVSIPRRSHATPVQQLNRDGVEAIRKHQFEKAKTLFYKAYLYDPDDPFTLNNLGYISELEGQVDRAQRFYTLATQQPTEAVIDRASTDKVVGKSVREAVTTAQDLPMQVNRANVEAIRLLSAGRAPEAETLLESTLTLDPKNVFTLNNMGVVKEMEGDLAGALQYYTQVMNSNSNEPVIVTIDRGSRGKPIHEVAAASERKLRDRMKDQDSVDAKVTWLNLRGVSAVNRNDWTSARQFFQQAYALDPSNAFSLNNLGYLSEMNGDSESAQVYYEKARASVRANVRVGYATRKSAEGRKLFQVADQSDQAVDANIAEHRAERRRNPEPILLKHRDNTPVVEPTQGAQPEPQPGAPATSPTVGPPQPQIPQLTPQSTPPNNQPPNDQPQNNQPQNNQPQ